MFGEKTKNPVVEPSNKCYSTMRYETYEDARVAKAVVVSDEAQTPSKVKIVKRKNGEYFELKLYKLLESAE